MTKTIILFCDMDGVLTNFEKQFMDTHDGKKLKDIPKPYSYNVTKCLPSSWWESMEWMPDGKKLWDYLLKLKTNNRIDELHILSSPTNDVEHKCHNGKLAWLRNEGIFTDIGEENCHLVSEKYKYVSVSDKCILIDDTERKIDSWIKHGGVGILHKNTEQTINKLLMELE